MVNEVTCLRREIQQVRDDRDRQLSLVQTLSDEVEKCRESAGKYCEELDEMKAKTNELEVFTLTFIDPFFILFFLYIICKDLKTCHVLRNPLIILKFFCRQHVLLKVLS